MPQLSKADLMAISGGGAGGGGIVLRRRVAFLSGGVRRSFFLFPFLELAAWWIFLTAMAVVFAADWRWYLIPDGALITV